MDVIGSPLRTTLDEAFRHAVSYLEAVDRTPVAATADRNTLRRRLGRPLMDESVAPEQVIRELITDVDGGLLCGAGGRFFGWVRGGSLPAALAADWLSGSWDQNAAVYATGPAAAVVEEVVGGWLKEILGVCAAETFGLGGTYS